MMNLFELMNNAQNGQALNDIAKNFGLDNSQMNKTLEAVMPAFSTALKRNTTSPDAMTQFMKALSSGNHQQYFENASTAFSADGIADGNNILGHMFGSKDVSRAVAAQAEAATGVGQDIIKKLLPVLATTLMGGMFDQTNQKMGAMTGQSSGNVFGDMMNQMLSGNSGAGAQTNPLGQILGGLMGGNSSSGPTTGSGNPLADMMGSMLGGQNAGAGANPFAAMFGASQDASDEQSSANPYDELFGKMFESGKTVQDEYQKNVDNIFDQFLGGMDKK